MSVQIYINGKFDRCLVDLCTGSVMVILTATFFDMLLSAVGKFYSPNLRCCNRGTVTTGAQTDNM